MILEYFDSIIQLFLLNPFAQTSWFIWMICVWIAFLFKDDLMTIKMLLIANIFWWLLYIWLESYAGVVSAMIWALRLLLSMKYKKNIKVFLFLVALITITWVMTYDSYYSLLPIIGSFIWAYSFFFYSWIGLRIWCLLISIIWLIYGLHIWSIWWVINEVVVEALILVTLYNYLWLNGYKLEIMSKVKSIMHPYRDVDYWHFTVVKDTDKISTKYNLRQRILIYTANKLLNVKKSTSNIITQIRLVYLKVIWKLKKD